LLGAVRESPTAAPATSIAADLAEILERHPDFPTV
jgi:hypothetical protein